MKKINVVRVLLGGLIAGVVLNAGEYLFHNVVFTDDTKNELQNLNLPAPGSDFIAKAVVATFILGIVITFLYAVIRTQFGPGVTTAIYAGLLAWFFTILYPGVIYNGLGMVSTRVFAIGLAWGLVEFAIGAIAGAWPYKEAAEA